jgi:FtsZ-interacting cell division protein YlmF
MAGFVEFVKRIAGIYDKPEDDVEENYESGSDYYEGSPNQQYFNGGAAFNGIFREHANNRHSGGNNNGSPVYARNNGYDASVKSGGDSGGNNYRDSSGQRSTPSNVVPMHPQRGQNNVLVFSKPDQLADAQQVCEHLRNRHIVIVNVEDMDGSEAQRLVDFIGGAVFALDGDIQDYNKRIFAVAPSGVELLELQPEHRGRSYASYGAGGG